MLVMKFGGSSLESTAALRNVAAIVGGRLERRPAVVVSAMGKTTNRLLAMGEEAASGRRDRAEALLLDLKAFHIDQASPLIASTEREVFEAFLDDVFAELGRELDRVAEAGEMDPELTDSISSFGERISSTIFAMVLRGPGLPAVQADARGLIVTDSRHTHAMPLFGRTYAKLEAALPPLLSQGTVVVLGGFIGSTQDGITTTLGRGGSDFSASIVGAGISAEAVEIWTDVDGMLTCDPRILPGGHRVRVISFAEAAELAYFGAKVLHPATVLPAMEKNIPLLILNSRRPEVEGTRIVNEAVHCGNAVKSIACKRNITLVNLHSTRMLMAHGFLRRIFEVFDRYRTPVDVVATSEVSVSLTVDSQEQIGGIIDELGRVGEVEVENDQAILCLVGENIRRTPGIAARVFASLGEINVRMISQGASALNITVVVDARDVPEAVSRLHQEFFRDIDPAVFEPAQNVRAA